MKPYFKDYKPPTGKLQTTPPSPPKKKYRIYFVVALAVMAAIFAALQDWRRPDSARLNSRLSGFPEDTMGPTEPQKQIIQPGERKLAPEFNFIWAGDSSEYSLECTVFSLKECLLSLENQQKEMGRSLNSFVQEYVLSSVPYLPEEIIISFQKGGANQIPTLNKIALKNASSLHNFILKGEGQPWQLPESPDTLYFWGTYCDNTGACLETQERAFRAETKAWLDRFHNKKAGTDSGAITFSPGGQITVFLDTNSLIPVMKRGKVVQIHSPKPDLIDVEIYHGKGFYIIYQGLSSLSRPLLEGDWVSEEELLGIPGQGPDLRRRFSFAVHSQNRILDLQDEI